MTYYTLTDYMSRLYDERSRGYALDASSMDDYEAWKAKTRQRLAEITGLAQCRPTEPNARKVSEQKMDGYTREGWLLNTEPDVVMSFYLLRPDNPNGLAMINPHGHGGGADNNIDNTDNPAVADFITRLNLKEAFAVTLAKAGYFVACPDARGSGARREKGQQGDEMEKLRMNSHREINQMALGFGMCVLGMMVWDLMRLMDFMQQIPEVDKDRIGCFGMSGGGQQTLYFAALDDRVKVAVTSGYFYGFKEALMLQPGNCSCNFIPHIWETVDMGDLGALIAPRPFLVETGRKDHLNGAPGIDNVIPQVDITRSAYGLFGAQERVFHSIHEEGHRWDGKDVLPFIQKYL